MRTPQDGDRAISLSLNHTPPPPREGTVGFPNYHPPTHKAAHPLQISSRHSSASTRSQPNLLSPHPICPTMCPAGEGNATHRDSTL